MAAKGATVAASGPDLAQRCTAIVLSLPRSEDVEDALFGRNGLALALAAGSVVVDTTSGRPAVSRRVAEALSGNGVGYLDAGVSGGVEGAAAGTLKIMIGGDAAARRPLPSAPRGAGHEPLALRSGGVRPRDEDGAEPLGADEDDGRDRVAAHRPRRRTRRAADGRGARPGRLAALPAGHRRPHAVRLHARARDEGPRRRDAASRATCTSPRPSAPPRSRRCAR